MMPDSEGIALDFQCKSLADWEVDDVQAWLKAGAARQAGWEKKLSTGSLVLQAVCCTVLGY